MHGYESLTTPWQAFVLVERGTIHLLNRMGGGGGGGNTIPCNWKEIYRGYKLSATCVQHSKCTVHRG